MQRRSNNITTLLREHHMSLHRHHCHTKQREGIKPRKLLLKLSFDTRLGECQVLFVEQSKTFNRSEDVGSGKSTRRAVKALILLCTFPDLSAVYEPIFLNKQAKGNTIRLSKVKPRIL